MARDKRYSDKYVFKNRKKRTREVPTQEKDRLGFVK